MSRSHAPTPLRTAAALLLAAVAAHAADRVPPELGFVVLLKVLTYDAGFDRRGSGDFVVLVPYASRASADKLLKEVEYISASRVKTRTLSLVAVEVSALKAEVAARQAAAVLVPDDAPPAVVEEAVRVCDAARIYGLSLSEAGVQAGLALGVAPKDGRPQVLLNLAKVRAIGAEFPPNILRVARVVQ